VLRKKYYQLLFTLVRTVILFLKQRLIHNYKRENKSAMEHVGMHTGSEVTLMLKLVICLKEIEMEERETLKD
jgi:hypothetical protein